MEFNYEDNMLNGEAKYYGDNKQLMIVLYYKNDALSGYSYEDKTGKLLPMTALAGGSGTVTAYYRNGIKSFQATFNEDIVNGDRNFYWSNGKETVSYTHLDVYKRQISGNRKNFNLIKGRRHNPVTMFPIML